MTGWPPKAPEGPAAAQVESGRRWPRDLVVLYRYPIEGEARIVAADPSDFWQGWATGTLKS